MSSGHAGRFQIDGWPGSADPFPPAVGSGFHGTTGTVPFTVTGGVFDGVTIAASSKYYVVWSGDPDASSRWLGVAC